MSIAKYLRAMHIKNFVLVPAISLLCLSCVAIGCDKKAATNSNFEDGINHYLKTHPVCLLGGITWPIELGDRTDFDALVAAGVMSKTETRKNIYSYAPTSAAQPSAKGANDAGAFCYGFKKVEEITNFTEPSDAGAEHVSVVSYTWKMVDVPDWAKNLTVQKAYPQIANDVNPDPNGKNHRDVGNMVLTHQGWRINIDQ